MSRNAQSLLCFICLFAAALVSQASSAATLTVTDDLHLWLRADAGVFSDAGTTPAANLASVQQWNDQLAGDNIVAQNVSQASAGNRPQYIASGLNGLPVIRFNAGTDAALGDYMDGPSVLSGPVARTVFVVGNSNLTGTRYFLEMGPGVANANGAQWRLTPEVAVRVSSGNVLFDQAVDTSFSILAAQHVANADTTDVMAYLNGDSLNQGPFVSQSINTANAGFRLGADNNLGVANDFDGDIAEVLIYERFLTPEEMNDVGAYLTLKYGIATSYELPPVPEPSSAALMILGLVSFRLRRKGRESLRRA